MFLATVITVSFIDLGSSYDRQIISIILTPYNAPSNASTSLLIVVSAHRGLCSSWSTDHTETFIYTDHREDPL